MTTDLNRAGRRRPATGGKERAGVIKRSISIAGHATSISLEEPFWQALKRLSDHNGISLAALVAQVDSQRGRGNLSSALRVAVLDHLVQQVGGHPD